MTPDVLGATEVVVAFEGPRPQRRLTVFFRLILAIPLGVFSSLLWFVGFCTLPIAWTAALFLGRMPEGLHDFLAAIVAFTTRVHGYSYLLLTDRYPSFDLYADRDAIVVVIPPPGRLNRAAVLFRYVLAVPVLFASSIVTFGAGIVSFFVWLIVLVRGSMPTSIFEAFAVTLRYLTRVYAYFGMLTSEYPRGLFGDDAVPVRNVEVADALPDAEAGQDGLPRITRFILSKAAKRLVIFFLVLGSLSWIGSSALSVTSSIASNQVADRLEESHEQLDDDVVDYEVTIESCGIAGGSSCVQDANRQLADSFLEFRAALEAESFSSETLEVARDLRALTNELIEILDELAVETDVADYQRTAFELRVVHEQFMDAYEELIFRLRSGL
jgi:hypothetical protein